MITDKLGRESVGFLPGPNPIGGLKQQFVRYVDFGRATRTSKQKLR